MNIGIDQLSFYAPRFYLDLAELAQYKGIDANKFYTGLGQEKIAVPPFDEDIVSMGVNAALPIVEKWGMTGIDTVLFATETGIDQSKAAAVYVHQLLGLPSNCRTVELKQACYSATAALQLACAYVARQPEKKVLVIASDIARYDLDSAAEPTQGAGAVAMLITAHPRLAIVEPISGLYSEDVMDFWRPNYRLTPLVDGKFSTIMYLKALEKAWQDYCQQGGKSYDQFAAYCYHLPFGKMGQKAHAHLARLNDSKAQTTDTIDGMQYSRLIGNSYTASLYISLASLLDFRDDLARQSIALFSYGSGCVGEFFAVTVADNYLDHRGRERHQQLLVARQQLSYQRYRQYHSPANGSEDVTFPQENAARCRLTGIFAQKRAYEIR